jgi:hypothetical protein
MSGPDVVRQKKAVEAVEELAGSRGAPTPARAVRHRDLDQIAKGIVAQARKALTGAINRFDSKASPGVHSWARPEAAGAPPVSGLSGGAIAIPKGPSGIGTWIAAGHDDVLAEPRVFAAASAGNGDQMGPWRELLHAGNILTPPAFENGQPAGGVVSEFINAQGYCLRLASGLQICAARAPGRFEFSTTSLLLFNWVLPAPFIAPYLFASATLSNGVDDNYLNVSASEIAHSLAVAQVSPFDTVTFGLRAIAGYPFASDASVGGVATLAIGRWGGEL